MSRTLGLAALLTLVLGCSHRNEPNVATNAGGGETAVAGSHGDTPNVPTATGSGSTLPYLATDRLQWAEYGTWEKRMVFMLWIDLVGERGNSGGGNGGVGTSPSGVNYHGSSRNAKGLNVEWQCETPNAVTGSMKVNGISYDLAKGHVFLVRVAAGGTQVQQLERDLSKLKTEDITAFSMADAEIARFIAIEKK